MEPDTTRGILLNLLTAHGDQSSHNTEKRGKGRGEERRGGEGRGGVGEERGEEGTERERVGRGCRGRECKNRSTGFLCRQFFSD